MAAEQTKPLLFISHRHDDSAIADVFREFVTYRSGGRVAVHQSSSAEAQAPRFGRNVNQELKKALWKSDVLLLIYTSQEGDWDYCMWECGVATHSESEDTNVIVLQCGRRLPPVLRDQLAVDVRDPVKLRKFVNEFLTHENFFPGREKITEFADNDANVERAARSLLQELEAVLPDYGEDVEEWPAVPFIRLELGALQVGEIVAAEEEDAAKQTAAAALLEAVVLASDREAAALFGRPTLPSDQPFGNVLSAAIRSGERPEWLDNLAEQVMRAARWNFPSVRWGLMRSANENDGTWYSPVLTHVRRFPSRAMQFDIHFQRFACPPGCETVTLALPGTAAGKSELPV